MSSQGKSICWPQKGSFAPPVDWEAAVPPAVSPVGAADLSRGVGVWYSQRV